MDTQKRSGIPLSALNPKFLHTNSTSHTWPFSAIAELIDNAYDPDVKAKQFWIDWTRINGFDCLTFMDNGSGMNRNRMHKMLSFGFSDKQVIKGHIPVGVYGNGFKSGSMRLGKDALVFSKTRDTMSVGLLSQSYLEAIRAQHVMVPIVTFRRVGQNQVEDAASLQAILTHSLFRTESELFSEFRAIRAMGTTGTRIIVWNLRRITNGETEFDFNTNRYDIQILANAYQNTSEKHECEDRSMSSVPEREYSLRAYCSILYLKPRMQIVIRGQKVKTQLISKSLAHIAKDYYRPNFLSNRIRITFGYNTKSKEQYGIMMYHKNRLIKAYERVGCQRKADSRGVGVIGVIECNFLQPTHNKQDFDNTDKYRKVMYNLGLKLEDYWNEIRYKRKKENPKCTTPIEETFNYPDQNWVQCDKCLKWRRLPDGIDCSLLPDKWFCRMNPDPQFRSCQAEEEPEDSGDDQRSYPKPYKKQRKNSKIQHENGEQVSATPLLSSERPQEGSLARSLPLSATCLGSAGLSPITDTMPISTSSFRSRLKQKLALYTVMNTSMETDVMDVASSSSSPPAPPLPPLQIPAYTWTDDKPIFRMTERRKEEEMEAMSEEQVEFWQEEEALVELTDTETATAAVEETLEQGQQDWYLLETQQQQDQLMELMQATAQERDGYKEQVHQLQKEVMEITCKCEALETKNNESKEVRKRLESAEAEKCSLSSQCEQLQRELEELRRERGRGTQIGSVSSTSWGVVQNEARSPTFGGVVQNEARSPTFGGVVQNGAGNPIIGESWQRLRNLRRSIGRLLVTFVPSLDLNQVNFDTGVIDEILDQVLDEVT